MSARMALLALAITAAGAACDGDTVSPTPGELRVILATPNTNDGAVLFTVSGGVIDSVVAAGYRTFASNGGGSSVHIVVTGNVTGGVLARIQVPDLGRASSYHAAVEQVAARPPSYALQTTAGYAISVAK